MGSVRTRNNYWFSYKDYLDPTDNFTDFCCECLEGKQEYIVLLENLINKDKTAKIFVKVYGLEDKSRVITAETLIIFSKLSLTEIKQIFNEPKDIFPSDIREETDFSQSAFLIGDNGELISSTKFLHEEHYAVASLNTLLYKIFRHLTMKSCAKWQNFSTCAVRFYNYTTKLGAQIQ